MIGASTSIKALSACIGEPIDSRLILVKKTVAAIEQRQIKNTDRLSRALVKVLSSVKKDPTTSPEQLGLLSEYKLRIDRFDPRRNEKELVTNALMEACNRNDTGEVVDAGTGDIWDSAPPLPIDEQFRLVDIERGCSNFVRGESVLRPGTDTRRLIETAIDGREFSVPTLLKLYGHMQKSFCAGGVALCGGALFSELRRVLTESGALPAKDPNENTYAQNFFEEIRARA